MTIQKNMKKSLQMASTTLLAIGFLSGCNYQDKSTLSTASKCERTELRDSGMSISGDYPEYSLSGLTCVLDAVEFPDWAREDLESTRPIDGRKSAEWDNFVANWSYDGDEISITVRIKE